MKHQFGRSFGGVSNAEKRRAIIMVNERPKVKSDGRYSPKETAQLLGIGTTTLYLHTRQGHIRFGVHSHNKRRFYLGSEITRFWGAEY